MQRDETSSVWSPPPDDLELGPHQVDIWRIFVDLQIDSAKLLESFLSADESERAARFYFPSGRDRYIVAHTSLRHILGHYLCCEPHQLNFSKNEYGKPALIVNEGIEFNLSHSGDYALIAVTHGQKIGIDIERIRENMELERIARRFFSQREVTELMSLPAEERTIAFFTCWTRKEAYIKGQGLGLSLPLDSFDVSLTPNEPAVLRATRPDPNEAGRWTLQSLEVNSGYVAAVAVAGRNLQYRYLGWNIR
jgi:4'-phosphopantetheinyl transferase